jgi:hypothetical protein
MPHSKFQPVAVLLFSKFTVLAAAEATYCFDVPRPFYNVSYSGLSSGRVSPMARRQRSLIMRFVMPASFTILPIVR